MGKTRTANPAAVTSKGGAVAAKGSRSAKHDAVLEGATGLARQAAESTADSNSDVGEHQGAVVESERLVSHRFACELKGYRGWSWHVLLSRVPRARTATVCEVALLPGEDAVLAPRWLPWSERLQPGDLRPGDELPFQPDDPRLERGYTPSGDEEQDRVAMEDLALARARVLSPEGRDRAALRWYEGDRGPATSQAVQASSCGRCGFLVPLQGSLGQVFGVCTNEWSPDDGKVVSLDHGCGAHSETDAPSHPSRWPAPAPLIDEGKIETVEIDRAGRSGSSQREPGASQDEA